MRASLRSRRPALALVACALLGPLAPAWSAAETATKPSPAKACRLQLIGELKVDFSQNRPKVTGAVNGQPIVILIDTGAQTSMILRPAAQRLKLKLTDLWGVDVIGAGGPIKAQSAFVDVLTVAGASRKGIPMLVAGSLSAGEDMLLGQDFLTLVDEEFDLAHGVLRLLRTTNCADEDMPYWATSYSQAPFTSNGDGDAHIVLHTRLNGTPVDAILDSGAQVSIATLGAGARARVPIRAGAHDGYGAGLAGVGIPEQIAELDSFALGDETIRHTSLMFGDFYRNTRVVQNGSRLSAPVTSFQEMLLGADFLRSHRVLISHARQKIFFTYNGGPVFATQGAPKPAIGG